MRAVLPALLALVLAAGVYAWPQEEEDLGVAIARYRNMLKLGKQALEDLELPEAVGHFSQVIDAYRTGQLPPEAPLTHRMMGEALEGRARAYANLGRTSDAEADFEALIHLDVAWSIDREKISPKIVALYDAVRARTVATLAIETDPPGAEVLLNGGSLGLTPLFGREVPSGAYTLLVRAEGFNDLAEQITLEGGGRLDRRLKLTPNARGILVATSPSGVKVIVDGKQRGVTFGTAGLEYAEPARRLGLSVADISAPLLVDHLRPGKHLLRLEKPCRVPQLINIEIAVNPQDNAPVRYEPMVLLPSTGSLVVESSPAGAQIMLDGKDVGRAPVKLEGVCSGAHDLVMRRAGLGQWIGKIDVRKDSVNRIRKDLRMTLVLLNADPNGSPAGAAGKSLAEILSGLDNFNVLAAGAGLPAGLRLVAGRAEPGDGVTAADFERLAAATGADLVVTAKVSEEAFERRLDLTIRAARYPALEDHVNLSLDEPDKLAQFLDRLDARTPLTRPWLGLKLIETRRAVNPVVIAVGAGSPASKAGIKVGERVVSLGGKPVATPADLRRLLARLPPGAQVSMTLQEPGKPPRRVNIGVGFSPVIVPLASRGGLRARFAAEMWFRARLEAEAGTKASREATTTALMNLGVVLMSEGLYKAALRDAFQKARLPDGPGISAGTEDYLHGLCLLKMNRKAEARPLLQAAAGKPDATLWTNDGPPVAERAKRSLASL